jgi:hypothetical protein
METKEVMATIWVFIYLIGIISFMFFLGWLLYSEFKLEKSIVDETHAHNGTCINHGYYNECSYQGDTKTIINSNSKCYINDIEINCSDIDN